jgi:serine/threonine protein kinase
MESTGQGGMQSGQTIAGKYRLNEPIGAGGMASVWSATNVFTERQFAIKFMHPVVAKTPEAARRFLMEAKVSARVNHPNIIEIIDVGQTEDGALFMVMELLQGSSLETAMRRQSPPMVASEFISVMIDVARALVAAHKSGVVHRDLKPTNIYLHMIRESVAVPKLLDFGVSKFLEDDNHSLTIAGTVLGSPLYMSPEQAMGLDTIDGRTDVFAFGAILFEALSGMRPYEAPNFNALIVMIATKQPRSIDETAPHLPEALRALIRDCLVTDAEKRISSFEEIVDRLLAVLPDLEQMGLRLPPHVVAGTAEGADAITVVPQTREQVERTPQATTGGVHLSQPPSPVPSGASPPAAFASPWPGDRAPDRALVPGVTTVPRSPPPLLFVTLGALLSLGAIAVVFLVARGMPTPKVTSATPPPPAPIASTPPSATSFEIPDPPLVPIDSLPVASSRVPYPVRGMGRVLITAAPGSCFVTIDGQAHGSTPLPAVNLPAGPHTVSCSAPSGNVKTMTVNSVEGVSSRYRFNLLDGP